MTSVALVTMPLTCTSFPMQSAFTSRITSGFCSEEVLNVTSYLFETCWLR